MGSSISNSLTRDEINHINSFPLRWNDLGGFLVGCGYWVPGRFSLDNSDRQSRQILRGLSMSLNLR